jgi:hypothetical protein
MISWPKRVLRSRRTSAGCGQTASDAGGELYLHRDGEGAGFTGCMSSPAEE